MKTSHAIRLVVEEPDKIFWRKCCAEFDKDYMTQISEGSEVPVNSIRSYKKTGYIGREYKNMLACYLFKKETWQEVVTEKKSDSTTQPERSHGDMDRLELMFDRFEKRFEKQMERRIELLELRLEKQIREHEHPFPSRGKHQKG